MQYTVVFFFSCKIEILPEKNDIFNIFAQNIDRGYMLEPLRRGESNEYPQSMFWTKNSPAPQFYYIKVGFKGVFIAWTCFPGGFKHCTLSNILSCFCVAVVLHVAMKVTLTACL